MAIKINVKARTNYGETNSLYARIDFYSVNRMIGILECGVSYFMNKEDADIFKITTHQGRNPYLVNTQVEKVTCINEEDLEIEVDGTWVKGKLPYTFASLLNKETVEIENVRTKSLVEAMIPQISFDDEGNQVITEQKKNILEYIDKQIEVKRFKVDFSNVDSDMPTYSYQLLEKLISNVLPDCKTEKI